MSRRAKPTFLDAAATVLRKTGRPMDTREITERAMRDGLLASSIGKTPERTMGAALYMDLRRRSRESRFKRVYVPGSARAVRNSVLWALRERTNRK